jgi:hypothetical protein
MTDPWPMVTPVQATQLVIALNRGRGYLFAHMDGAGAVTLVESPRSPRPSRSRTLGHSAHR